MSSRSPRSRSGLLALFTDADFSVHTLAPTVRVLASVLASVIGSGLALIQRGLRSTSAARRRPSSPS
ncbi:MAG: hypothetical protein IPI73_31030 [Betaproteobacteria bacterium]|nr:hypothetical protein [Betaproteobacteria bacterium]